MPEGLKNAGGSFSRMTAKVLHSQIGRNVLTYVDDIIHKARKSHCWLTRNICQLQASWFEIKSRKVCFWSEEGQVSWLSGINEWNQS
jgi:hypothetical protein